MNGHVFKFVKNYFAEVFLILRTIRFYLHCCNSLDVMLMSIVLNLFLRLTKLRETLQEIQELEVNMAKLRQWLAKTEHQLTSPVVYQNFSQDEIQKILTSIQVQLQRSVFLCCILLYSICTLK